MSNCNICHRINVEVTPVSGTDSWGEAFVVWYCDWCLDYRHKMGWMY